MLGHQAPGMCATPVNWSFLRWMLLKTMQCSEGELTMTFDIMICDYLLWLENFCCAAIIFLFWDAQIFQRGNSYLIHFRNGIEVNLWDINSCSKIWSAKSVSTNWLITWCSCKHSLTNHRYFFNLKPRADNLGIFTKPWFTAGTFLCKDDHRKIVACTNNHQVQYTHDSSLLLCLYNSKFELTWIKIGLHLCCNLTNATDWTNFQLSDCKAACWWGYVLMSVHLHVVPSYILPPFLNIRCFRPLTCWLGADLNEWTYTLKHV